MDPARPETRTALPRITDRSLQRRRIARALRRAVPGADWLLRETLADMAARLALVERRFEVAVALDDDTGAIATMLGRSGKVATVLATGTVAAAGGGDATACRRIAADAERLPLAPGSVDLVISALTLQWVNDLPGALVQIRRALRPDGLFLAALPGGETLGELRRAFADAELAVRGGISPRVLPFADIRDMGDLLRRAGFALPVCDSDRLVVRYDDARGLFADLRAMGATNTLVDRDPVPVTRRLLDRVVTRYADLFSDPDGRVRAMFDILSASGWAPHESQPGPAARGSATVSLASVLERSGKPARKSPS